MKPPTRPRLHLLRSAAVLSALLVSGCAASAPSPATSRLTPVSVDAPRGRVVPGSPQRVDPALAAAVGRLQRRDFVERAKAAERLVERGAEALPALGAAGSQPVAAPGGDRVSSTEPVIAAILASSSADEVQGALDMPWGNVRSMAAAELGRRGRWTPVPDLIARLGDRDADVRASSAASLRRLTNQFFGYRASARPVERRSAASRWERWWTREGRVRQGDDPDLAAR